MDRSGFFVRVWFRLHREDRGFALVETAAAVYGAPAQGVPSAGALRVTSIVSWSVAARTTSTSFQSQFLLYGPQGTGNAQTHVSGSSSTFFQGNGSASSGRVVVTPNGTV